MPHLDMESYRDEVKHFGDDKSTSHLRPFRGATSLYQVADLRYIRGAKGNAVRLWTPCWSIG